MILIYFVFRIKLFSKKAFLTFELNSFAHVFFLIYIKYFSDYLSKLVIIFKISFFFFFVCLTLIIFDYNFSKYNG